MDMDLKEEKQKKSKYMGSSKDCDVRCIERRWTPCDHKKFDDPQTRYVTLKLLHWNILAQRLCDGFDLIDDDAPPQWTVVKDWSLPIDAPGNIVVVSVPSKLDPSLAPPGYHVIHSYTAGNEPYEDWEQFEVGCY